MTAQRWSEVKAVLGEVMDAPEIERAALLDQLCGSDSEMRAQVESLLALEARAGDRFRGGHCPRTSSHPGDSALAPVRAGGL